MKNPLTPGKFVEIARSVPLDERVPYAFEKRIMAQLGESPAIDTLAFWTQALWRAAVPCFAIMLLAAAASWTEFSESTLTEAEDIDLESAVLAPTQLALDSAA